MPKVTKLTRKTVLIFILYYFLSEQESMEDCQVCRHLQCTASSSPPHPLLAEPIDIGRAQDLLTIASAIPVPKIVGQDQNDVWRALCGIKGCRDQHK
jgi:hypothetical protein